MGTKISIKAARVNSNIKQGEAAKLIGVTEKTLISWEKERSYPPADKLIKLCSIYNVSIGDIFFNT